MNVYGKLIRQKSVVCVAQTRFLFYKVEQSRVNI